MVSLATIPWASQQSYFAEIKIDDEGRFRLISRGIGLCDQVTRELTLVVSRIITRMSEDAMAENLWNKRQQLQCIAPSALHEIATKLPT